MYNEKIKLYDQLNNDEQEVLDIFRKMKLLSDQSRFELFNYKLSDLLTKYESLVELREETQALLFDVLEEISKNGLAIHIDYERLGRNRQIEADNINEEVKIIQEYKLGFDEALDMIYSGVAEELLIQDENNWQYF